MHTTQQRGISLFHGLFALAILAVMTLSIAPLCYRMLGDRYVVAYTNELVATLQQARHQAVNHMAAVSLCSSNNGRECTQTSWSQGYIAFFDAGESGVLDGDDRIIKAVQPENVPIRVVLNGADHIRFKSNGGILANATDRLQPAGRVEAETRLAGLWKALSPIATAHAETLVTDSGSDAQTVAFLVCSGQAGRAIRVTAIGRLDTRTVSCP